jgi:HK97 family phage major capsid protein
MNSYTWKDKDISFWQAVFSGRMHPELTTRAMNEAIGSDGGFLVPVEYSTMIHNVALEDEIVQPLAFVQPMQSKTMKIPAFTIGDHSSNLYGGFIAYYKGEATALTEADPTVRAMELTARKLTGYIKMSNELASDVPGGENQIVNICGNGLAWYRDKSFLKGSGAGEPLGILNASCLKVTAKEAGQSASTIVYENLINMVKDLHPACFKRSVWICHQTTIPQLLSLSVAVGTGGSHIPVMRETDGGFQILTRPVIFTEKTETLGSQGDILLADFSQYVVGLREEMRIDYSIHVAFTTDELVARLIERHDGQPLWDETLTLEDGTTTVGPFVTLAERI